MKKFVYVVGGKRLIIIRIVIILGVLLAFIIWYRNFVSGNIILPNDVTKRINVGAVAKNYRYLTEGFGFVYSNEFGEIPFAYDTEASYVLISKPINDSVVSMRIFNESRLLFKNDSEFNYNGYYSRPGIAVGMPLDWWITYKLHFVLESNYVSVGIYSLKKGDPNMDVEEILKTIMNSIEPSHNDIA